MSKILSIPKRFKDLTPKQFETWFDKYVADRHSDLNWKTEYKKIGGKIPKPKKKKVSE